MSSTIEDRVILILDEGRKPRGYWSSLEEKTGINAQRWRKVASRLQRPTSEIIEAIAKLHPHYAFWICTGITDATNGHIAPINALTFPERLYREQHWANEYFKLSLELADELSVAGGIDLTDDELRSNAYRRVQVFTGYHGSGLVNFGYEISSTEKYKELKEILKKRTAEKANVDFFGDESRAEMNDSRYSKTDLVIESTDPRTVHQTPNEVFWRPKNHG
ncbi:hypothetical protein [Vogesella mureinivorans]|uniref:hypothetical protein n=1 Tax=Vogesella mureinivorans TaxID=657276 RepID=UPI0011CA843F|nr:hypothetical protein [Vogesella mureinivorans]